ncbi:MAG: hypothetical protein L3J89_09305, partial [Gammaproteobacteria bacterium]|nr:hypothetical protein [Gammaproteobacteria bacterium]
MVKTASVAGQTHRFDRQAIALFAIVTLAGVAAPLAIAAPGGAEVVGGSGSISQSGVNTTILQNS